MNDVSVSGLAFTAIDFETANGFRGSPCSVGLVKVRDGLVVDTASWLMRPPEGFDRFDPRNISIHGISPEDVADAPRFVEIYPQMAEFIGDDVLVAHNAGFDLGVIESAMEVSGQAVPQHDYACSLMLARKIYRLPSYALPSAAAEAGWMMQNHHDALADARACAQILMDAGRRRQSREAESRGIAEVLSEVGLSVRRLKPHDVGVSESKATRQARGMAELFDATVALPPSVSPPDLMHWPDEGTNPAPNRQADPQHPLFNQLVVFTGNLGIPRQEAKNRVASHGASTNNRVTGRTSMLVVGDGFRAEDLESETPSPTMKHRKMRDALTRRAKGQQISIVPESEFNQMVSGNWPVLSAV